MGSATSASWLSFYWKVAERHALLERRVGEFLPRARASLEGVTTVLDAGVRNTVVFVTGQAASHDGEAVGEAVSASYFVAMPRPVVYHLGYSYGAAEGF